MKKLLFFYFTFFSITVTSQSITFTDENFKSALVNDPSINTNGDSEISIPEAEAYQGQIKLDSMGIKNLVGLDFFSNIVGLICRDNEIEKLDIVNFPLLRFIDLRQNKLTDLHLENLPNLGSLNCLGNEIKELDLGFEHKLTTIIAERNNISEIDLEMCGQLEVLSISRNMLGSIKLDYCPHLLKVFISENLVPEIDISQNKMLNTIHCDFNPISVLNLRENPLLTTVNINETDITELDVSQNDSLQFLSAVNIDIGALNLTQNPKLRTLNFRTRGYIDNLDFSQNKMLSTLLLRTRSLNSIDLTHNTELRSLDIRRNYISYLDLSHNIHLSSIRVQDNDLEYLNLANGFNENIATLDASQNPDLLCIQVDSTFDFQNPPMEWHKDEIAEYTTFCEASVPQINAINISEACTAATENGSIEIIADGGFEPYTYRLEAINSFYDSISTEKTFKNLKYGFYVVSLIDNLGQLDTFHIQITNQFLLKRKNGALGLTYSTATYSTVVCPDDLFVQLFVEGEGIEQYNLEWSSGSDSISESLIIDTLEQYNIILKDSLDNTCEIKFKAKIDPSCATTHSETLNKPSANILFPNPTHGLLKFKDLMNISSISIFDIQGRLMKDLHNPQKNVLDISWLEGGIYFIKYSASGNTHTQRVIKL